MNLEELATVFWLVCVGLGLIVIASQSIGIYAIISYGKWTNQSLTVLCLSLTELLVMLVEMVLETNVKYKALLPEKLVKFCWIMELALIYYALYVICILTIDRLVCAINPLKYKSRMTSSKVKKMLFTSFPISIASGVLARVLPYEKVGKWVDLYLVVFCASYALFAIVTYIYIIIVMTKSRAEVGATHRQSNRLDRRQFMVPALIIFTFFIFYLIPFPIRLMKVESAKWQLVKDQTCKLMAQVGIVVDPMIFVLLTPHYRLIAFKRFCIPCKYRVNNSAGNVNIATIS